MRLQRPLLFLLLLLCPAVQRAGYADPVSLMDLFPTVSALAGLPVPDGLDGLDLSSVLATPGAAPHPRAFAPSAYYGYDARWLPILPESRDGGIIPQMFG